MKKSERARAARAAAKSEALAAAQRSFDADWARGAPGLRASSSLTAVRVRRKR